MIYSYFGEYQAETLPNSKRHDEDDIADGRTADFCYAHDFKCSNDTVQEGKTRQIPVGSNICFRKRFLLWSDFVIFVDNKTAIMKKLFFFLAAVLCMSLAASAQNVQYPEPDLIIDLWPDGAPTDNGLTGPERDLGTHVSNVTRPTLAVFLPEKPNGLAVILCPGGGYSSVWDKTEGYFRADWYRQQGIVYAVLKYRLPNGHKEVPLDDVHRAISVLRSHAGEYGFTKLGIAGCSAGGHLASSAATHYSNASERPDFQILFYPVISCQPAFGHMGSAYNLLGRNASQEDLDLFSNELCVTEDTPPAFIMACTDDNVVPVRNSIEYYNALVAHKVSASLHIYPVGGHGWTDHVFPYESTWMNDLQTWLSELPEYLK